MTIMARGQGAAGSARARKPFWTRVREYGIWYVLILPNLISFAVFSLYCWSFLFGISFTRWSMLGAKNWIGLENYRSILSDAIFRQAALNTLVYALLEVFPVAALSLLLALIVNQRLKGVYFFRACFYLPVVTTMSVVAMIWIYVVKPTPDGILNYVIGLFGLPPQEWLLSTRWALPSLAAMAVWKQLGYYMLLWVAGLLAIPDSLYEAARIDGADGPALFWHITLPLLRPTTTFIVIIASIRAFQMFAPTYMMTGGGPTYSTTTIVFLLWKQAFEFARMGRSAAMAVVLFIVILILTLLQRRVLRWEEQIY